MELGCNSNDKVAAFVNGQCRGVSNLTYVSNENKLLCLLLLRIRIMKRLVSNLRFNKDEISDVIKP
jgi:hypothetical protein